jgi:hypothetical protein
MRFVLFTEKSVSQCIRDLNERLHTAGTKSRPELGGWIEKNGKFSLTVTSKVVGRFPRTTRLTAKAERESGVTVLWGNVSDGISPQWTRFLFIGLLIVAGALVISSQPMPALLTFVFGAFAYVPLRGDYINSDILLLEVERTLKASPKPPKK